MSSDAAPLSQDGSKRPSGTGSCCFPKFDLGTREALQAFKGLSALLSFHKMLIFCRAQRERRPQRKEGAEESTDGEEVLLTELAPTQPSRYVCVCLLLSPGPLSSSSPFGPDPELTDVQLEVLVLILLFVQDNYSSEAQSLSQEQDWIVTGRATQLEITCSYCHLYGH